MALAFNTVKDNLTRYNFEILSKLFPLAASYIADGAITTAKLANWQVVSLLPGSPAEGQDCFYLAATNTIWHLKYRSGNWEFVGGPSLYAVVETDQTRASSTFGDLTTVGPDITVPLAGDYFLQWGATIGAPNNTNWDTGYMALAIGATAATRSLASVATGISAGLAQENYVSTMRMAKQTGLSVSTLIRAKYANDSNAETIHFLSRWLAVTPIKVT